MPLPNLSVRSRANSSQIPANNTINDPMPNSYREQIRDRLQNTLRNNAELKSNKTDLNLTGEGLPSFSRSTSRERGTNGTRLINSNEMSQRRLSNSNNNRPTRVQQQQRQIVFYNKTYVPSISDKFINNAYNANSNDSINDDDNDIVVANNNEKVGKRRSKAEYNPSQMDENILRFNILFLRYALCFKK